MAFPNPISTPQQPGGGGFNPPKLPYPEVRSGAKWSPKVELPPIASVPFSDYMDRSHPNAPPSTQYEYWKMDNPSTGPYPAAYEYGEAEMDYFGPSQLGGGPADLYPQGRWDFRDHYEPPKMHHEIPWPNTAPKSVPYGKYIPKEKVERTRREVEEQLQVEGLIRERAKNRTLDPYPRPNPQDKFNLPLQGQPPWGKGPGGYLRPWPTKPGPWT